MSVNRLTSRNIGSVARIGPNDLMTNDPDILRRMSSARSKYGRSHWYEVAKLNPYLHSVGSEPDEKRHQELRTKLSAGYSGKEIPDFEGIVDKHVLELVDLIERKYISDGTDIRPCDVARKIQYFTLDTITDIAFGEPFGDVPADEDVHRYIQTIEDMFPLMFILQGIPGALKVMQAMQRNAWLSPLIMPSHTDRAGFGTMMGLAKRIVAERFGPNKKEKPDQLGSFIRHGLTQEEAEGETLLQITAGSDTTAGGIRSTIMHLITQPTAFNRLRQEISEAEKNNRISKPIISNAEARALPYLQACIKEGLRLLPPVTSLLSKKVPPGGDILDGKFVPEGTDVGYCAWSVHRNKAVFGEDAECFRPQRWLEASPEQLVRMDQTAELIFGYGRYGCLGRVLALTELNKVIVEVSLDDLLVAQRLLRPTNRARHIFAAVSPVRFCDNKSYTPVELQDD
ncbi:hypothetical protein FGG08_004522 [Glutinoglossum americanum]|uniref:Pisatin demethylase n=1 Tax=Glutinoglossum americanum TaxID=1670608 RepID=A0A9P8I0G4_9PEZI|nr:hypothetical protein FGG08_004522 [Glutinoglossum americanum]